MRTTAIEEALPMIINTDPALVDFFIEQTTAGATRRRLISDIAQQFLKRESSRKFPANYLEDSTELPQELKGALTLIRSISDTHAAPQ